MICCAHRPRPGADVKDTKKRLIDCSEKAGRLACTHWQKPTCLSDKEIAFFLHDSLFKPT